jgi:nucleoside-diphosphate-sugar epimerase
VGRPDVIFHLAAIVSGEAEMDFEKGYAVNFAGTRALLDAIRVVGGGYHPTVVFASSIAVFGAPFPEAIPDDFIHTPLTSYGTQKAMRVAAGGLTAARLPQRRRHPAAHHRGAAGQAQQGGVELFLLHHPRAARRAGGGAGRRRRAALVCEPRAAVGFLVHAAGLGRDRLGPRVNLTMPGVRHRRRRDKASLTRIRPKVAARIRRAPDELVTRIVSGWPQKFDARRATDMGFADEASLDDIIRAHIEDELGGKIVG